MNLADVNKALRVLNNTTIDGRQIRAEKVSDDMIPSHTAPLDPKWKIAVLGIPNATKNEDIEARLAWFGPVRGLSRKWYPETANFGSFAHVIFEKKEDFEAALRAKEIEIGGRWAQILSPNSNHQSHVSGLIFLPENAIAPLIGKCGKNQNAMKAYSGGIMDTENYIRNPDNQGNKAINITAPNYAAWLRTHDFVKFMVSKNCFDVEQMIPKFEEIREYKL